MKNCVKNKSCEAMGIRRYIHYVNLRVKYANLELLFLTDNEFKYYAQLKANINKWFCKHKTYSKFLSGKISFEVVKEEFNTTKRNAFRKLAKQRKELIHFIFKQEIELYKKYPFENGTEEFCI